ncbi:MAG: phosphoribosyl-ATP diphosphatase [Actinobacteria bacterium]|uniref:phosphoribosyl-ATP diphosphatase n=1 Tax=freshwater metagenome TaxID=449393 RepID=A0A6J6VS33_9ZZZZ|nr:phosphoribosyl-ATP diphosphatase [Actinomycetota bacterium]MSO33268.1 phosphoribosyl-ATP diphosphatase [Candidatus Nanopelagicaceae bacterium]GDX23488.1 phosphoribosyl-ATP pyrophosphatase [Actinomycetes bacterium]MSX25737.1 phosphoribosyl-ATP diphosphatase [Actinomycetota bacterium]MSY04826.1 phosphoribosyl-ATP diphosphatase [Actinomycetota bacterium]
MKTFEELWRELGEIARTRPAGSNTSELLAGGVHAIGKKIIEEAAEVWMAAEYESDEDLALEISQLLYYLQVMMLAREIEMDAVYQEL